MRKVNIVIFLLMLPAMALAQFSGKGKIITMELDTIECLVQIDKEQLVDVVKFKRKKEDYLQEFPLSDLYRIIIKDKVYENISYEKKNVLGHNVMSYKICLCLVDGFVKLYKEGITMFVQDENHMVNTHKKISQTDIYYVAKGNEEAVEMYPKFFVKQSQRIFSDYSSIVQLIREEKYQYKDLVKIVENCNESYYGTLQEKRQGP